MLHAGRYIDHMRSARGSAASTLAWIGNGLSDFEKRTGISDPKEINLETLDKYAHRMAHAGLAPSTRRARLTCLKGFLAFLAKRRLIAADPGEDYKTPRPDVRRPRTFTPQEIEALIFKIPRPTRKARGRFPNLDRWRDRVRELAWYRDRAVFAALYYCGLRAGEIGLLRLGDFDARSGKLFVRGKGAHRDTPIALHDRYLEAVRAWLAFRAATGFESSHLFPALKRPRETDSGMTPGAVRQALAVRMRALGIPPDGRSAHSIRASVATHLLKMGADVRMIQVFLRHRRLETTLHYLEAERQTAADVIRRRLLIAGREVPLIGEVERTFGPLVAQDPRLLKS